MATKRSTAPSRAKISAQQTRYVDTSGRIYVLPNRSDERFKRFVELDHVDSQNYERQLRKGLEFDPEAELKELTGRVFMYVQLPTPHQQETRFRPYDTDALSAINSREGRQMPVPTSRAGGRRLVLKEATTGRLYEVTVDTVHAKRRDKRGFVILTGVHRIN